MKKKIAALLCLVLMFTMILSGCGANEKDAILGTWEGTLDMTDALNASIAAAGDEEMAKYLAFDYFELKITMTFNADDTYALTVDEEHLSDQVDGLMEQMVDCMYTYMGDYLAEMGLDMSVDELLAQMGYTMEQLVEEYFDRDDLAESFSELETEGNFKVADGKLYMSEGTNYAVDEDVYETYTIEGSTLTISEGTADDDADEIFQYIYPMVLNKVG